MSRFTVSFQDQIVLDSEEVVIEALDRDTIRVKVNLKPTHDRDAIVDDDVTVELFKGGRACRHSLTAKGLAQWEETLTVDKGIDARNCTALLFTSRSPNNGTHLITGRSAARRTEWPAGDGNSLLPVRPDESLGSLLCEMQFDGGPMLAVRDTPAYPYTRLTSDEIFLGVALPDAIRQVVHWLASDRDNETQEQADAWLRFLGDLMPGFDLASTSEEQVHELARTAAMAFAKQIKIAESLESKDRNDVYT